MLVGQTARPKWEAKAGVITNFLQDGTVVIEYHVEYEGQAMKGERFFDPGDVVIVDQDVQELHNFKTKFHIELEKIMDSVVKMPTVLGVEFFFVRYKTFLCEVQVYPDGTAYRRFSANEEWEYMDNF